jgi:class I fructose-bisphosphate aldolase
MKELKVMIGKEIRMERVINRNTKRTVIIPMDHGVSSGPIPGLLDLRESIGGVVKGGANAIVIHKGLVSSGHRGRGKDVGLIIHMSASTSLSPDPNAKTLVCTVEEAMRLGADAVSIHVNIGADDEKAMIRDFGIVSKTCTRWGMPLLAMVYPRGSGIKDEYDVRVVKHAARLGAELGADIVKVSYTGSPESFREVIEGCFVPVVIAGGAKMETDRDILEMVKGSVDAGGAGVSIGRNAFQHHNPSSIVKAISNVVHKNATVEEALELVEKS